MKKLVFVFLLIFIFVSCKQAPTSAAINIGEEFDLQVGKTVQISGQNFTIRFKNVAEDSRCPANAICKWEGNAKIVLQLAQKDTSVNTTLEPKEITLKVDSGIDFTVRLISVSPYPTTNELIELKKYSIRLIVFSNEIF